MSAGTIIYREDVDYALGQKARALLNDLASIQSLFAVLSGFGLNGLEGLPSRVSPSNPYNPTDAQNVMNAITDMNNIAKIASGLAYVVAGSTAGSGVPTNNDSTHFGYSFPNIAPVAGLPS